MRKCLILLILALFSINSWATDGGVDVGGGTVVVCKNAGGSDSVSLLDLYENEEMDSLTRIQPTGDTRRDAELVGQELNRMLDIQGETSWIVTQFGAEITRVRTEVSPQDTPLPRPNDFGILRKKPASNCSLQLVAYFKNNRVHLYKDLYNQMSITDRAALWVHEAIYHKYRQVPQARYEMNSMKTRYFTYRVAAGIPILNYGPWGN